MKISVSLFLSFNNPEHSLGGQVEVRGILNASDRPRAGEKIYWPCLNDKFEDPHDQDCSLYVVWSDFHTVAPGKIAPRIELEDRGGANHQENLKRQVISDIEDWKETHKAIREFLLNPTVRWGEDYVFVPFPINASDIPSDLSLNFKERGY